MNEIYHPLLDSPFLIEGWYAVYDTNDTNCIIFCKVVHCVTVPQLQVVVYLYYIDQLQNYTISQTKSRYCKSLITGIITQWLANDARRSLSLSFLDIAQPLRSIERKA
jgi:hypothetical protein